MKRTFAKATLAAFSFVAVMAMAPAPVGPPWISIEYPPSPFDATTRDAFLLVHAFHHGTPMNFPVAGRAEGVVAGKRKSITLDFTRTSRDGVYALRKQWPDKGVWTLVIGVTQGEGEMNTVKAVVEIGTNGQVASVVVPTKMAGIHRVPAPVNMADVESDLKTRAARVASR